METRGASQPPEAVFDQILAGKLQFAEVKSQVVVPSPRPYTHAQKRVTASAQGIPALDQIGDGRGHGDGTGRRLASLARILIDFLLRRALVSTAFSRGRDEKLD